MSSDRGVESLGLGYWLQEIPSYSEARRGLETLNSAENVDIIVSHAAPEEILVKLLQRRTIIDPARFYDHTARILEACRLIVENRFPHVHWFHGHYHSNITLRPIEGFTNLTYTCLYEEIEVVSEQDVYRKRGK